MHQFELYFASGQGENRPGDITAIHVGIMKAEARQISLVIGVTLITWE